MDGINKYEINILNLCFLSYTRLNNLIFKVQLIWLYLI